MSRINLTAKQEKFVQGLIAGLSQREAYKQSYKADNMKDTTIDSHASRLLKNDKVSARYRELLKEYSNMNLWTREAAFNEYEWLKNKAKESIEEEGVRKAAADAFLSSLEGMNQMTFRELELADEKLKAEIEVLRDKLDQDETSEDKLADYLTKLNEVYEDE